MNMNARKITALLLVLVMALSLAACGGKKEEPAKEPEPAKTQEPAKEPAPAKAEEPPEPGTHVSSAKELLAKLESGAEILIEPGTYDLTAAALEIAENEEDWYDKYPNLMLNYTDEDKVEVQIVNAENLTIRGSAKGKVELTAKGEYSDVLSFNGCTGVTLENLTMGHSDVKGECTGDVVEIWSCHDVVMKNLDLYGCGAYAVDIGSSTNVSVEGSTLRECSYGALTVIESTDVIFRDCTVKDNKDVYTVLETHTADVHYENCTFRDNDAGWGLLSDDNNSFVLFEGCTFGEWETEQIANKPQTTSGVFDEKCSFTRQGVVRYSVVKDVDGLMDAIRPDAVIYVEDGTYDLSAWAEKNESTWIRNNYISVGEVYDGWEIHILDADGLVIRSRSGDPSKVKFTVDPRYAAVLWFDDCDNITLAGFTAGHTETGECSGDVLFFENCVNVTMDDLDLYGCGVNGIGAYMSGYLCTFNSTLRDCSWGPFQLDQCYGTIAFQSCTMTGNEGWPAIWDCDDAYILMRDCTFGERESEAFSNYDLFFEDCHFAEGYEAPYSGDGEYMGIDGPDGIEDLECIAWRDGDIVGKWTGFYFGVPESGYETELPAESGDGVLTASLEIRKNGTAVYKEQDRSYDLEWEGGESDFNVDFWFQGEEDEWPDATCWVFAADPENPRDIVMEFNFGEIMVWLKKA